MALDKNEKLCQVLILECKGPGENSWCYLGYENITSPHIFNLFSGKQVMRIFQVISGFLFKWPNIKLLYLLNVLMSLNGTASPFNPQEWLASNFSSQHHCWLKSSSQEIKGNDHHFKKIMIMRRSPCRYHRKCIGTVGRIWKWELGTHRLMIIFQELNRTSKEND